MYSSNTTAQFWRKKYNILLRIIRKNFVPLQLKIQKSVDGNDQFALVGVDPVLCHGARDAVDRLEVVRQERTA